LEPWHNRATTGMGRATTGTGRSNTLESKAAKGCTFVHGVTP